MRAIIFLVVVSIVFAQTGLLTGCQLTGCLVTQICNTTTGRCDPAPIVPNCGGLCNPRQTCSLDGRCIDVPPVCNPVCLLTELCVWDPSTGPTATKCVSTACPNCLPPNVCTQGQCVLCTDPTRCDAPTLDAIASAGLDPKLFNDTRNYTDCSVTSVPPNVVALFQAPLNCPTDLTLGLGSISINDSAALKLNGGDVTVQTIRAQISSLFLLEQNALAASRLAVDSNAAARFTSSTNGLIQLQAIDLASGGSLVFDGKLRVVFPNDPSLTTGDYTNDCIFNNGSFNVNGVQKVRILLKNGESVTDVICKPGDTFRSDASVLISTGVNSSSPRIIAGQGTFDFRGQFVQPDIRVGVTGQLKVDSSDATLSGDVRVLGGNVQVVSGSAKFDKSLSFTGLNKCNFTVGSNATTIVKDLQVGAPIDVKLASDAIAQIDSLTLANSLNFVIPSGSQGIRPATVKLPADAANVNVAVIGGARKDVSFSGNLFEVQGVLKDVNVNIVSPPSVNGKVSIPNGQEVQIQSTSVVGDARSVLETVGSLKLVSTTVDVMSVIGASGTVELQNCNVTKPVNISGALLVKETSKIASTLRVTAAASTTINVDPTKNLTLDFLLVKPGSNCEISGNTDSSPTASVNGGVVINQLVTSGSITLDLAAVHVAENACDTPSSSPPTDSDAPTDPNSNDSKFVVRRASELTGFVNAALDINSGSTNVASKVIIDLNKQTHLCRPVTSTIGASVQGSLEVKGLLNIAAGGSIQADVNVLGGKVTINTDATVSKIRFDGATVGASSGGSLEVAKPLSVDNLQVALNPDIKFTADGASVHATQLACDSNRVVRLLADTDVKGSLTVDSLNLNNGVTLRVQNDVNITLGDTHVVGVNGALEVMDAAVNLAGSVPANLNIQLSSSAKPAVLSVAVDKTATIDSTISGSGQLKVDGSATVSGSVSVASVQAGATADLRFVGPSITVSAPLDVSGTVLFDAQGAKWQGSAIVRAGGALNVNGPDSALNGTIAVDASGALRINADRITLHEGITVGGSLDVNSNDANIKANLVVQQSGAVWLSGDRQIVSGNIFLSAGMAQLQIAGGEHQNQTIVQGAVTISGDSSHVDLKSDAHLAGGVSITAPTSTVAVGGGVHLVRVDNLQLGADKQLRVDVAPRADGVPLPQLQLKDASVSGSVELNGDVEIDFSTQAQGGGALMVKQGLTATGNLGSVSVSLSGTVTGDNYLYVPLESSLTLSHLQTPNVNAYVELDGQLIVKAAGSSQKAVINGDVWLNPTASVDLQSPAQCASLVAAAVAGQVGQDYAYAQTNASFNASIDAQATFGLGLRQGAVVRAPWLALAADVTTYFWTDDALMGRIVLEQLEVADGASLSIEGDISLELPANKADITVGAGSSIDVIDIDSTLYLSGHVDAALPITLNDDTQRVVVNTKQKAFLQADVRGMVGAQLAGEVVVRGTLTVDTNATIEARGFSCVGGGNTTIAGANIRINGDLVVDANSSFCVNGSRFRGGRVEVKADGHLYLQASAATVDSVAVDGNVTVGVGAFDANAAQVGEIQRCSADAYIRVEVESLANLGDSFIALKYTQATTANINCGVVLCEKAACRVLPVITSGAARRLLACEDSATFTSNSLVITQCKEGTASGSAVVPSLFTLLALLLVRFFW